jgi:hypothetical protein
MAFTFIIVKEVRFFLNESQIVLQPCFKSQPAYRCGWLGFFSLARVILAMQVKHPTSAFALTQR